MSSIQALNMTAIQDFLIGHGGMTIADAMEACEAGKRDLIIAAENPGLPIVPTFLGDQAIHVFLELPGLSDMIAESVAGVGARFIHQPGDDGDWEHSEQLRYNRFGTPSRDCGRAGCMLELKPPPTTSC
jgi:hypothetical protein